MGKITPSTIEFVSGQEVYDKVSRFLSSFNTTNVIDYGEWAELAYECMELLNISTIREMDAVCVVKDYRAKLPDDFKDWYSGVKVTPYLSTKDKVNYQGGVEFWNDITCSVLKKSDNCEIDCCDKDERIISKVTIRQYLGEKGEFTCNYRNPLYLRLSPNVAPNKKYNSHIPNFSRVDEVTIDNGFMFLNFTDDHIYLKYYGKPVGEDGMPVIPDIVEVKKAIEWYIIYQTSLGWWWNSEVPDIQTKWAQAKQECDDAMAAARYILKLPRFSTLINSARNKRAINKVTFFGSTDWDRM